ncbi:hypothetical protein ACWD7T_34720, partial [Streptomyces sp. 900116325]
QHRRPARPRRARADPPAPKKKAPKKPAPHPGLLSIPEPPAVEPLLAGLAGVGRHWTLLMPYVEEMLTSNQRLHWRPEHRIRKRLRSDATSLIRPHRLPRIQRAAIFYVLHPRSINRSRDPGNWAPTAKAYVDGLVTPNPDRPGEHHLLPDDDHEHLLGPNPVMGAPVTTGFARMSLVIVELTGPVTSGNAKTVTGIGTSTYMT